MVMYMTLVLRLITENKKGGACRPNPLESLHARRPAAYAKQQQDRLLRK